jgi:hypothetical protein
LRKEAGVVLPSKTGSFSRVAQELSVCPPPLQVAEAVLGTVKNLRSAVQKSALLCLCDLLESFGDQLLPVLAGPPGGPPAAAPIQLLLLKAGQDKRFVADEAQRALRTLAEKCSPAATQALLLPLAAHKSPKVHGPGCCVSVAASATCAPQAPPCCGR